jgi:hypothetical protein
VPERPNTTSSSRARTRPWWSRVRSTIPVTARSLRWRPGFQMCSSTPSELTPARRAGSLTRRSITGRTASQTVCQSTPSRRATAATLVSSHPSAATAQSTARAVSRARGGIAGWASVRHTVAHSGFGQRQTRLRHSTMAIAPKQGTSWARCSRRPWPTAVAPHAPHSGWLGSVLHARSDTPQAGPVLAFGQSRAPGPLARLAGPLQSRSSPRAGLWCRRRP